MDHPFVTVPSPRRSNFGARAWAPRALALALATAGLCGSALAAGKAADKKAPPVTAEQLQQLMNRMQQLEQRNSELEQQVKTLAARQAPTAPATAAATVPGVTGAGASPAPGGDWGQQRLVSLEQQVKALARPVQADPEDELTVETGLVAVGQHVGSKGSDTGQSQGRLNYRGDVEVSVQLGTLRSFGEAKFTGFGHLRFGQGIGVSLRPTHTATVNSVPFEAGAGSDETYAIIAQAWGQLEWDLGAGRFNDLPGNRIELNLGKIDIFGFFDQNAVAGNEGAQFLNNVFVHNPMLDSGGDIAADAYGFAPGLRVAYIDEGEDRGWGWAASFGVFGSGSGANFSAGPRRPLVIGQVEFSPKQINGEPRSTYRLYAWTNGQTTDLSGEAAQRHSGYGLSVDQKIGREWNLFGRWGHRTSGDGAFDKSLTFGFEHGGRAWGRGSDAVGLAAGFVRTSSEWKQATTLDPTLVGFAADGNEQILEAYYRWRVSDHLELTPDLQWIRRAGGNGDAPAFMAVGLRAAVGF